MKTKTPTYIRILYFILFAFLSVLVIGWIRTVLFGRGIMEGATTKTPYSTNPKYTYAPSASSSAPKIEFGLSDLDAEFENACAFLKLDSSLSFVDPSASAYAITIESEGYSVAKSDLKIHTLYNNSVNVNKTDGIKNAMDASYGALFDSNNIKNLSTDQIVSQWNGTHSVKIDDAIYNTTSYYVIHSEKMSEGAPLPSMATDVSATTLGNYFLQGIIANKFSPGPLANLKNAYYAIVKPRFLANTISNVYWSNWQALTNADGTSHDSICYAINTMNDLVANATLPADLSGTNVQSILSTSDVPTPFTLDAIRLYQTTSVAYELHQFIIQFPKEKPNPIQTTPASFVKGFQQYLDTLNKVSVPSTLAFVLQNPPATSRS